MKKLLYQITLFLLVTISFYFKGYAQERDEVGHRVGPWTSWSAHSCYKGIYWRIRRVYYYEDKNDKFINSFEFKNHYNTKVAFSFIFLKSGENNPTTSRKTLKPGETYRNNTLQYYPGDINLKIESVCFSFYDYNGTVLDNCSEDPDVFKKDYFYSECDNGTPNIKKFNGNNSGKDHENSGSRSDNGSIESLMAKYNSLCAKLYESNDKALLDEHKRICTLGPDEEANTKTENTLKTKIKQIEDVLAKYGTDDKEKSLDDLIADHKTLCQQLRQTDDNAHNEVYNAYCTKDEQLTGTFENQINTVKNKIQTLKNAIASADAKTNEKKSEAERLRKEAEEKSEKFNQYMAEGRTALGKDEFDNAISKFSTARSYASTPQETAEADRAIAEAQKAKKDAARKVRLEEQKKRDTQEDAAFAAGLAGTTGMMLLLKDHYPYKSAYFRMQAGLGGEGIPLIINTPSDNSSETYNNFLPTFYFGFKFGFFNNKAISWHLNPIFSVGISALSEGTSGGNIDYGGTSYLSIGTHSKSKFKLFAEGGYIGRLGSYSYDADAASGGITATDLLKDGTYGYSLIRMGGGPMLHFIHDGKETVIKPGLFFDKMSFAQPGDKPSMLFNLHVNIESSIIVEFSFSQNYAIPGKASYPYNFTTEDRDYWNFKVIKQGLF